MTDRPTCTATNRAGNRCGRYPAIGATVCHFHGGAAPQVRRQAKRRRIEARARQAVAVMLGERQRDHDELRNAGLPVEPWWQ